MVTIRAGSAADAAQIAAVQLEAWIAAYEDIIPAEIIDRVTAADGGARVRQSFRTRPFAASRRAPAWHGAHGAAIVLRTGAGR